MKNGIGHGFFITGTDTGIGKTYVSRILVEGFAATHSVAYMKPIQTGCPRRNGIFTSPDLDYVLKSNVIPEMQLEDQVPYRFEAACSPHLAASRAGIMISLEQVREKYGRIANKKSVTIVEGSGGVLTPLSETSSMIDLMLYLRLPVILVTTPRIGTINHTLLTLDALAKKAIDPVGIVMNNQSELPENYIYHDTMRIIRDHAPAAAFLEVAHDALCDEHATEFCDAIFRQL